jgi:hypothetical protein
MAAFETHEKYTKFSTDWDPIRFNRIQSPGRFQTAGSEMGVLLNLKNKKKLYSAPKTLQFGFVKEHITTSNAKRSFQFKFMGSAVDGYLKF